MKKFIVCNWKMNGSLDYIQTLNNYFVKLAPSSLAHEIVICPQSPYLKSCKDTLPSWIHIAGQDCNTKEMGAFTGCIAAYTLKECGATFCLIGHSERRGYFQESLEEINEKIKCAQDACLTPIVCVGEALDHRENFTHKDIIKEQVISALKILKGDYYIAYEPIWAIGTGRSASLFDIEEMCSFIQDMTGLSNVFYGGSVTPSNASEILKLTCVRGLLVGGACLKLETFSPLVERKES